MKKHDHLPEALEEMRRAGHMRLQPQSLFASEDDATDRTATINQGATNTMPQSEPNLEATITLLRETAELNPSIVAAVAGVLAADALKVDARVAQLSAEQRKMCLQLGVDARSFTLREMKAERATAGRMALSAEQNKLATMLGIDPTVLR